MPYKKILIIRFSSFGDVVQCMPVVNYLKKGTTNPEIHWLTRKEYAEIVSLDPSIDHIWKFDRRAGLLGLLKLSMALSRENYDLVYDAHCNLRSLIIKVVLYPLFLYKKIAYSRSFKIVIRKKERFKRFLLFWLKINKFPNPFKGALSYMSPIESSYKEHLSLNWSFNDLTRKDCDNLLESGEKFIALIPSAAWGMKRWPIIHWKTLIRELKDHKLVLLGGPEDFFLEHLREIDKDRIINLGGKLSLVESCYILSKAVIFVSGDTGLSHVGDLLGLKGLSLMGPTAFGHPSNSNTKVIEIDLPCRPCSKDGRGHCIQKVYQRCMVEITPTVVAKEIELLLTN